MAQKLAAATSNVTNSTLQHHIRACSDARSAVKEASAEFKVRLKAAKVDGCNTKMLAAILKDREADPDKVIRDIRDRIRMLALVNIPCVQTDLFGDTTVDESSAAEQSNWEADAGGYAIGVAGGDRGENRHSPGTELYGAWDTGYLRGQAKIARGLRKGPKVASTRRKRANGGEAGLPM